MEQYNGMYIGVVVQNNDPERRGRVKVFVPHVNAGVYENWYGVKKDKSFRFVGKNVDSDLSDILVDLKTILPWCEQAAPLVGQASSGRYNAYNKTGSVSDTNTLTTFTGPSGFEPSDTSLNEHGTGEAPARKYELDDMRLNDAFSSSDYDSPSGARRPNKYSYNYRPSSYSNCGKGIFAVPDVGAHVWMFFREGDVQHPAYFAVALGGQDWHGIYGNVKGAPVDYPGAYENQENTDSDVQDINIETYRNKFLINQKGGTLEFVNTDNREILKMTHYSGSFKEFNNNTSIELAAKNDQKLVLHDQYLTVNGYGGWYVGRDLDHIIQGDHFLRVGQQNDALHRAWREKAREMHHIKQLFETQRADQSANKVVLPGAFVSPLQDKVGNNTAPCPVCKPVASSRGDTSYNLNEVFDTYNQPVPADAGDEHAPGERKYAHADFSGNSASLALATQTGALETWVWTTDQATVGTVGDGADGQTALEDNCPACDNGFIMGSMDGTWDAEPRKQASTWLQEAKRIIGELADIESGLGMGGSEVVNVAKHKTETIGMVMNDFGSVRVDTEGKFFKSGVHVLNHSVVNNREVSPVVEYVHVDDLPGGSYTLNVCNRWNVQVGAGGVSMKSYGPVDIGGTITNIGGTQVNIGSENEVNIDGGKRVNIVGDILTLRQRTGKQVLVDSNLGVTKNVVIGGGLHVEGEVTLNHVTAPGEIQETYETECWGSTEWTRERIIGWTFACWNNQEQTQAVAQPVYSHINAAGTAALGMIGSTTQCQVTRAATSWVQDYNPDTDCIRLYPHSHHFNNLPLTLKKNNEHVRADAANHHDGDRVAPKDREWKNAEDKVEAS